MRTKEKKEKGEFWRDWELNLRWKEVEVTSWWVRLIKWLERYLSISKHPFKFLLWQMQLNLTMAINIFNDSFEIKF